jgi:hypothetical protein
MLKFVVACFVIVARHRQTIDTVAVASGQLPRRGKDDRAVAKLARV